MTAMNDNRPLPPIRLNEGEEKPPTEHHCPTCICGKRAPVQGSYTGERHLRKPGQPGYGAGTISWEEYMLAYASYANLYGGSQSAERLAARGGLGWFELVNLLGREPTTWQPAR